MSSQKYTQHQIETCINDLTYLAHDIGNSHNVIMTVQHERAGKVWVEAPLAYQASMQWKAVEVIRQLQTEIEMLTDQLNQLSTQ